MGVINPLYWFLLQSIKHGDHVPKSRSAPLLSHRPAAAAVSSSAEAVLASCTSVAVRSAYDHGASEPMQHTTPHSGS